MNLLFNQAARLIKKLYPERDESVSILESAKIFLIDNLYTNMKGKTFTTSDLENLPSIAPPYPVMWFEWAVSDGRMGVLASSQEIHEGGWSYRCSFFGNCFNDRKDAKMTVYFLDFTVQANGTLRMPMNVDLTEFPPILKQVFFNDIVELPGLDRNEIANTILASHLGIVFFAIGLMHCKNIVTLEKGGKNPNVKNRRHRSKGTVHYVLDVIPARHIKRTEYEHPAKGSPQRIHFRRGHFKEYTTERPLFGKYTGAFWWDAHVAGSTDIGEVKKEYRILPMQQ